MQPVVTTLPPKESQLGAGSQRDVSEPQAWLVGWLAGQWPDKTVRLSWKTFAEASGVLQSLILASPSQQYIFLWSKCNLLTLNKDSHDSLADSSEEGIKDHRAQNWNWVCLHHFWNPIHLDFLPLHNFSFVSQGDNFFYSLDIWKRTRDNEKEKWI